MAAMAMLAACSGPGVIAPSQPTPSRSLFLLRQTAGANVAYANLMVAQEAGIAAKYGLNAPVKLFDVAFLGYDAMVAGQADTAGTSVFPFLNYQAKAPDLITVAVMLTANDLKIVVKNDIKVANDVVGKRIGFQVGSAIDYAFARYLEHYRIPATSVKIVNLPAADLVSTMARGDIDGFVWLEPVVSNAFTAMGDKIHLLVPGVEVTFVNRAHVEVLRSWAESNRPQVVAFLRSLIDANAYIKGNKQKAAEITGKLLNYPADKIPDQWANANLDWTVHMKPFAITDIEETADWMFKKGILKTRPDVTKIVDTSFLKEIDPALLR